MMAPKTTMPMATQIQKTIMWRSYCCWLMGVTPRVMLSSPQPAKAEFAVRDPVNTPSVRRALASLFIAMAEMASSYLVEVIVGDFSGTAGSSERFDQAILINGVVQLVGEPMALGFREEAA